MPSRPGPRRRRNSAAALPQAGKAGVGAAFRAAQRRRVLIRLPRAACTGPEAGGPELGRRPCAGRREYRLRSYCLSPHGVAKGVCASRAAACGFPCEGSLLCTATARCMAAQNAAAWAQKPGRGVVLVKKSMYNRKNGQKRRLPPHTGAQRRRAPSRRDEKGACSL